jgi:hypothetical protein
MVWLSWALFACGSVLVGTLLLALWLSRHNTTAVTPSRTERCDERAEGTFDPCPSPAVEHLGGRDRCARHAELYRYYYG